MAPKRISMVCNQLLKTNSRTPKYFRCEKFISLCDIHGEYLFSTPDMPPGVDFTNILCVDF